MVLISETVIIIT